MDDQTKIKFTRVNWDAVADRHLAKIDGLLPCDIEFYRRAVDLKRKGLMGVFVGDQRIGTILWCLSDEPKGRAFVIDEMAADCKSGIDLTKAAFQMAHIFAPQMGAKYLRLMTRRKGLIDKLKDQAEVTYILEKTL